LVRAGHLFCAETREQVRAEYVTDPKRFRRLLPRFERLREVGVGRKNIRSCQPRVDQYRAPIMLFLINSCA